MDNQRVIGLVASVLVCGGCGSGVGQQPSQAPTPQQPGQYVQRFIHIQPPANVIGVPWSAFALDTKTGLLCKTYPLDRQEWVGVPQCVDLYARYPDGGLVVGGR